jgi:hypothetical protein
VILIGEAVTGIECELNSAIFFHLTRLVMKPCLIVSIILLFFLKVQAQQFVEGMPLSLVSIHLWQRLEFEARQNRQ